MDLVFAPDLAAGESAPWLDPLARWAAAALLELWFQCDDAAHR